jgi:hypothetical protein
MIIVRLMGGLGNQMFQYALGSALSLKNNSVLKLDLAFLLDRTAKKNFMFRDFDLPIFNIRANIASPEEVKTYYNFYNRARKKLLPNELGNPYIKEKVNYFDPAILTAGGNCYLHGHWGSEKYFKEYEAKIRQDFTFKAPLTPLGRQLADEIQNTTAVCLNVRRGDYVTNPEVGKILSLTGIDYFRKAIDLMRSKVHNPHFFVFSDDQQWVNENIRIDLPMTIVDDRYNGEKYGEKLHLMSLCKHFIIPNSSFAWWGAWLSSNRGKIVVTPEKWFVSSDYDSKDIRPEGWLAI